MRLFVFAAALTLGACAPLPDYQYVDDAHDASIDGAVAPPSPDASTADGASTDPPPENDGAPPPNDSGPPPPNDSGPPPPNDSGPPPNDSGPPATTCPSNPPPAGIDACCDVACIDRRGEGSCGDCNACNQLHCAADKVCCYRSNGSAKLDCKNSVADCK